MEKLREYGKRLKGIRRMKGDGKIEGEWQKLNTADG